MITWILFALLGIGLIGYSIAATLSARRLLRPRRQPPTGEPAAVGRAYEGVRWDARGEALASEATPRIARTPPMTMSARGRLEMRWYRGVDGLYTRWELPSPAQDDDAYQLADETYDAFDMAEHAAP